MSTRELYTTLTGKIAHVRRAEHLLWLQTEFFNVLAGLISIWTVAGLLEYLFRFGIDGRTSLFWGATLFSIALAFYRLYRPVGILLGRLPHQSDDTIARRVGERIPTVGDRLVNTLQLYRGIAIPIAEPALAAPGVSMELAEAAILRQGSGLERHDYSVILARDDRRRSMFLLLSSLLTTLGLFLLLGSDLQSAYGRLVDYRTHYQVPAPFALSVEPGDVRLVRGDSLAIRVRATGIPPRSVILTMIEEGEERGEEVELQEVKPGLYEYHLPSVHSELLYSVASAGVESREYRISLDERPELSGLTVRVAPPSYTHHPVETLPDGYGDVSGLRGTRVSITARTSIPVVRGEIVQLLLRKDISLLPASATIAGGPDNPGPLYDTLRTPLKIEGNAISGSFTLQRDGEYYLSVVSESGLANPSPVHYSMSVSTDGIPSIALLQPTVDPQLDESLLLPTQVRIADDYGFSRLRIIYRTGNGSEDGWGPLRQHAVPIPRSRGSSIDIPYLWHLADAGVNEGEEVELYFEVFDNDVVAGPKSARTGTLRVTYPSAREVIEQANSLGEKATADLQKLLQQAEKARKDMESLDRELAKQLAQQKQNAGWQEKQKLEDLIKQHEQMQRNVEQIAEDLRTMAERLQEARAISPETLQKYEELQKLFEEVNNEQLKKSMQQVQQEMEKMSPEEMAEAMKNYRFNEEEFRQAIERTKKVLERMKDGQEVDQLKNMAERLADQQEELNRDIQKSRPDDRQSAADLAERQKRLAEAARDLQERSSQLTEGMKQKENGGAEEMDQANRNLQQKNPAGDMESARQKMEQNRTSEAEQNGQDAQQSLEEFSQQMEKMQQQMEKSGQQQVMNGMKKSLKDLLELSKQQEDLRRRTEQAPQNSPAFRDLAREQEQLGEEMRNVAQEMMDIGEQSFAMTPEMGKEVGNAMRQMDKAEESLENRNGQSASSQQNQAMSSMNRGAKMMADALARMQNQQGQDQGSGGSSFKQRLQQMAAQQQMINMAMGQGQGSQGQGAQSQGAQSQGEGEGEADGEGGGQQGGGKGKGEENGGDGMAGRLMKQQQEVKKSVDELNREARESGGTRKNMVGDLEQAGKEIQEVLQDMQSGRITEETLRRQEKILSRMLDAMKSQRERDFERERESSPGKDIIRTSPPGLSPFNPLPLPTGSTLPEEEKQGYSRDYEYLIRRYFEMTR